MKCKIQLMCFKSILSKIVCDSLNLMSQNAETAAVEVMGPLAACEEDQRYLVSSPVMGGVLSMFSTPVVKNADIL